MEVMVGWFVGWLPGVDGEELTMPPLASPPFSENNRYIPSALVNDNKDIYNRFIHSSLIASRCTVSFNSSSFEKFSNQLLSVSDFYAKDGSTEQHQQHCQRQSSFFMMGIFGISIIIFILNKIKEMQYCCSFSWSIFCFLYITLLSALAMLLWVPLFGFSKFRRNFWHVYWNYSRGFEALTSWKRALEIKMVFVVHTWQ